MSEGPSSPTLLSSIQLVVDTAKIKNLFYVSTSSGQLMHARMISDTEVRRRIVVYKGPLLGFSAAVEETARFVCYIQTPDGKIILLFSDDSGLSWQEAGEVD